MNMPAEPEGNDTELLSAYLDGQLTDSERLALEARLEQDTDLRQELAQLRLTVELIRSLPALTAPRDFSLNHMMVYDQRRERRASYLFSFVSAAAAVVLLVVGAFLTLNTRQESLSTQLSDADQPDAIALLATDAGLSSPVPTAALADTFEFTEVASESRQAEPLASADDQAEAPLSFMFAPTADAPIDAAAPSVPAAAEEESPDSATTMMDQFSASEAANAQTAPSEFETLTESPPAEFAEEAQGEGGEAAAGITSVQATPPPAIAAQPTFAPPSETPAPTMTAAPEPTPIPASPVPAPDAGTVGILLIAAAVVLLAVSIFTFLLSRRG